MIIYTKSAPKIKVPMLKGIRPAKAPERCFSFLRFLHTFLSDNETLPFWNLPWFSGPPASFSAPFPGEAGRYPITHMPVLYHSCRYFSSYKLKVTNFLRILYIKQRKPGMITTRKKQEVLQWVQKDWIMPHWRL